MRRIHVSLCLLAVCSFIVGTASLIAAPEDEKEKVPAAARKELAAARNATAKYHDIQQALADGYALQGYVPGEGFEYVNFSLVDCHFDPTQPEALHYIQSGNRLRLVGVEYVIPIACTATQPEGFSGDADEWEFMAEGLPIWALNAWLWIGNPNGIFAEPPHPRIP